MTDGYRAQLNQVGWTLCTFAILVTLARCYCRLWITRRFGWDDGFMVLAMLSGIGCISLVTVATEYGFGLHLATLKDQYRREQAVKYTLIAPCLSIVSSTCSKTSMVLFMLGLLGPMATRIHRWFLFSVTAAMVILNIFIIVILIAFCDPVEKSWKPELPGKCLPIAVFGIGGRFQSVWNALMDLVTAAFPAYMIRRLQIKTSTKWGLSFMMGGGVFGCAATIVKVAEMKGLTDVSDITYSWGPIAIWYMVEIYVLIIAGSMPTLKPIWSELHGKVSSISSFRQDEDRSNGIHGDGFKVNSKRSSGFGRRPGSVTIALNDIDNLTKQGKGDSEESILPKQQQNYGNAQQLELDKPEIRPNQSEASLSSSRESISKPRTGDIHVERNFSVKYD